jgi:hypothetical protein
MTLKEQMDTIYRELPIEEIPWNVAEPPSFGGGGKHRTTPLCTTLYCSSEDELRQLFEPFFHVEEMQICEVAGKRAPHIAVKALMSKKDV